MDILLHLPAYRVSVCQPCGIAVAPHKLQDHLNNLHRYPPLSLTTIIKIMEARLPVENRVSKCHRGRWPMLKSQMTEMLMVLVLHWVNWRAQGNNYVSQGGEHGIPLSLSAVTIHIPGPDLSARDIAPRCLWSSSLTNPHLIAGVDAIDISPCKTTHHCHVVRASFLVSIPQSLRSGRG